MDIQVLAQSSSCRDFTVNSAIEWMKGKPLAINTRDYANKYGKNELRKYLEVSMALEILIDKNVSVNAGSNLLETVGRVISKSNVVTKDAVHMRQLLKYYLACMVSKNDYASVTYEMLISYMNMRRALRYLNSYGSSNTFSKALVGESYSEHIMQEFCNACDAYKELEDKIK